MMSLQPLGLPPAILLLAALVAHGLAAPVEKKVSFRGYQVVRVFPQNEDNLSLLDELHENTDNQIELWGQPVGNHSVDLQLAPTRRQHVLERLGTAGIRHHVLIADIQNLIDEDDEEDSDSAGRVKRAVPDSSYTTSNSFQEVTSSGYDDWLHDDSAQFYWRNIVGKYARHGQINLWLNQAKAAHPSLVTLLDIGLSYEGRPLRVIKVGSGGANKPAIWLDAGIHAREWIAPATAVYIIFSLIHNYGRDATVRRLVDTFDWYILPVVNPDGYEYTHTTNRMWRKTRSRTTSRWCTGVDANRNFDFKWKGHCKKNHLSRCRSDHPCHSTYAGPQAFSEPETVAVANQLLKEKRHLRMYLSLHSYSQLWLTPWGHKRSPPPDIQDLNTVATAGIDALKSKHGTSFVAGSPAKIIYAAGGSSYDWAKGVAGIKYSYTLELRDTGHYGFLMPRRFITPTGEETWEAIKAAALKVIEIEPDLS